MMWQGCGTPGVAARKGFDSGPGLADIGGTLLAGWLGGKMDDLYGSDDLVWWIGVGVGAFSAVVHLPIRERRDPVQMAA